MRIGTTFAGAILIFCALAYPIVERQCAAVPPTPDGRNETTRSAPQTEIVAVAAEHLPNAYQVHPKVISGGQPAGEQAFAELQRLGVKTVISVDGAKPDLELASKYGLRYVHLPHGYDGISAQRAQELAKAVQELEGPIYIHCHHGKHRSPAAAAVACVTAGLIDTSLAQDVLETAGTSKHYRGLYQAARDARPMEARVLRGLQVHFPETAQLPPLAEAMVTLEHTLDNMERIAAAGWQRPAEHPDLEPAHEALLLREHFTELLRTPDVQQYDGEFQAGLKSSEAAAKQLETALRQWKASENESAPPRLVEQSFMRIQQNCIACHQKYRDVPLGEK